MNEPIPVRVVKEPDLGSKIMSVGCAIGCLGPIAIGIFAALVGMIMKPFQ